MSWDEIARSGYRQRQIHEKRERRLKFTTWAFAGAALIAAGFVAYLSGETARLREQVRRWEAVAHAEATNASVASAALDDMEIDRRAALQRENRTRGELESQAVLFGADLRRLADIDDMVGSAGFSSVTEALAHARVHHGQILACSSALVECRSWFQWCQGGFWRGEASP